MSGIVKVQKGDAISLQVSDGVFAYGEGLFETLKVSEGALCFWEAHWARMNASALALGFEMPATKDDVLKALSELVRSEGLKDGILKLSLVRQNDGYVLYLYSRSSLTPLPQKVSLQVETETQLNANSVLAGHKSHNYMEAMTLWRRAHADGFYDCLRFNVKGHLAEACVSNIFFIKGGVLCTPSLATGILPGVARDAVLTLAAQNKRTIREGEFILSDLEDAEAVFLTNSVAGVVPVATISNTYESSGEAGDLLGELCAQFAIVEKANSIKL